MILFDLAVIVVGSVVVLSMPAYRNVRAIGFLLVLGGLLLAANLVTDPGVKLAMKGAAIGGYLIGLMGFPHWLAAISRRELAFDERLTSILRDVRRAHDVWAKARLGTDQATVREAKEALLAAYGHALESIDALDPPGPAWVDTTERLRAYVTAANERARLVGPDAPASGPLSDAGMAALVAALNRAWDRALGIRRFRRLSISGSRM